ncbi:MAG: hypothetical protein KME64_22995 [Scytonematopsis contorta HA4267-MV1]|jgi:hypothetical protein|nr:hypothetical protein [Scytonematopsis contorta HA4267-MV1]
MGKLQINDLDFCESANDNQVQGGFSYLKNYNKLVVSSFSDFEIYDWDSFDNFDSFDESLFKGLSEKELAQEGNIGYRIESEDGKKVIFGIVSNKGDTNFIRVSARVRS